MIFTDAKIDNHVGLIVNENEMVKRYWLKFFAKSIKLKANLVVKNIFFLSLESDKYLVIWGKV